jgi:hypothetical protein
MEIFCNEIIAEIKTAKSETELIRVIAHSLTQLRNERNSFNEEGYMMNMIVSLRALKAAYVGDNSPEFINNIQLAIAIFRQFQKDYPQRLF